MSPEHQRLGMNQSAASRALSGSISPGNNVPTSRPLSPSHFLEASLLLSGPSHLQGAHSLPRPPSPPPQHHTPAHFYQRVIQFSSVQFSSVAQSCPTLCDPMNCSTPGLPVHHQHLEFTQTHIHRVSDAIQPSHPLSSPSLAPNPSQHQRLFQ